VKLFCDWKLFLDLFVAVAVCYVSVTPDCAASAHGSCQLLQLGTTTSDRSQLAPAPTGSEATSVDSPLSGNYNYYSFILILIIYPSVAKFFFL
jgi:hypothetical protein